MFVTVFCVIIDKILGILSVYTAILFVYTYLGINRPKLGFSQLCHLRPNFPWINGTSCGEIDDYGNILELRGNI